MHIFWELLYIALSVKIQNIEDRTTKEEYKLKSVYNLNINFVYGFYKQKSCHENVV